MKKKHSKPKKSQNIAKQRMYTLFEQADKQAQKRPDLAKRYVTLARKIGMKFKVPVPRELKRRFCKACSEFWVPQRTCRVRLRNSQAVYTCLKCKHISRFRYK